MKFSRVFVPLVVSAVSSLQSYAEASADDRSSSSSNNNNNEDDTVMGKRGSLRVSSLAAADMSNIDNEDHTVTGFLRRLPTIGYGCPNHLEKCGTGSTSVCCGGGQYCKKDLYCKSKKSNGSSCSANKMCTSGWCNNGVCSDKLSDYESCSKDNACESGWCYSNIGQCATKGELKFGTPCKKDWWCDSDVCTDHGSDSLCLQKYGGACTDYEDCATGRCKDGLCKNKASTNTKCVVDDDCTSGYCAKYTTCENGLCTDNYKCKKQLLDECDDDSECYSGKCAKRIFQPLNDVDRCLSNPGDSCELDIECQLLCLDNHCRSPPGQPCDDDSYCLSGICQSGVCF